ncbi:MAG TPA: hypothetical protein VLB79_14915 [Solirubrobacterales bacterium]|nr:hypothetical protein [Solirubrobacterales bacterium]
MALTDEQRTMLQLLLEGGQGYDDIGSLLGVSADEVRSRARSALQEVGGADPDAQVGLTDYLLGQADPIGRADAVRHLQSDPEANALAQRLVQNLRLLAPRAELPEIPEPRGGRRAATPPPPPGPPAEPAPAPQAAGAPPVPAAPRGPGFASRVAGFFSGLAGLSGKRRTQFGVGMAALLALVIVVVVVATSGGSSDGNDCKGVDTSAAQQAGVPTIKLVATGAAADADCPPSGQITLGATQQASNSKNQTPTFALQANAVHLPPTGNGDRYLLWLYKSDTQSLPLGQETVDSSGNLTGGVPLIAQQVLLLPAFDSIRISKVTSADAQQLQQSLQQQGKKATGVIQFVGQPVLEGNISELGLDQLLQQAQSQAQTNQGSGKKG